MPQGLRGRVALIGAGVACCYGLAGCMNPDAGKAPPVSKAKAGVSTPPGARTTTGNTVAPVGGSGIPNNGGYQPGTMPGAGAASPYNPGTINAPARTGNMGAGGAMPGMPPVVPSVLPTSSNYPPAGAAMPAGFGTQSPDVQPTAARGAAPTQSAPPTPMLTDLAPPAPPGGPATPADTAPPTPPASYSGPLAPLAPPAPPGGLR